MLKQIVPTIILISLITVAIFSFSPVLAQEGIVDEFNTDKGPMNLCAIVNLANNIKNFAFVIAGSITVLVIIIGGVMRIIAGASQDMLMKAKKTITGGIIGLIITLTAWIIVGAILVALFLSGNANEGNVSEFLTSLWQIDACQGVTF